MSDRLCKAEEPNLADMTQEFHLLRLVASFTIVGISPRPDFTAFVGFV
jgi:hypothetical protein